MKNLISWLSQTRVLIASFVFMMLCGAGFGLYLDDVGGKLLDEASNAQTAQNTLNAMSEQQKASHFYVTTVLDTLYPLLYGAFFVGMIHRFAGSHSGWAVWPSIVGVAADFVENASQALALNGDASWLFLKDIVTPIKFGGLAIGLLLIVVFGVLHFRASRKGVE